MARHITVKTRRRELKVEIVVCWEAGSVDRGGVILRTAKRAGVQQRFVACAWHAAGCWNQKGECYSMSKRCWAHDTSSTGKQEGS